MVDTKEFFDVKLRQRMVLLIYNESFHNDIVNSSVSSVGVWGMDEVLLYELCKVHGEPPAESNHQYAKYRPLHGPHWSHHTKSATKGYSLAENCDIISVPGFINMLVNWKDFGSLKFFGYYFSTTRKN